MPLLASPHLLPAADISGDIQSQETQTDTFGTELPLHSHLSPSIALPSGEHPSATMMATATFVPPRDSLVQQATMTLGSDSMQLSNQGRYFTGNFTGNFNPDDSAFTTPAFFASELPRNNYPQQLHHNGRSYDANYPLRCPPDYTAPYPRTYDHVRLDGLPNTMIASYPPSTFYHAQPSIYTAPSLPDTSMPELMQLGDDYEMHHGNYFKPEDQIDYTSSYSDVSRGSTPYGIGYEGEDVIDKEQPYAQLIYRALLSAPNHTMILRDIYDWFKRYTDKASQSETKGWQNSIRHNLSMNGVS